MHAEDEARRDAEDAAQRDAEREAQREAERLRALVRLGIVGTSREEIFDDLVAMVADSCRTGFAALSFVERTMQWFKASVGFDVVEADRRLGGCDRVVRSGHVVSVQDALDDELTVGNAQLVGPASIRSYVASPVRAFGEIVGSLCVMSDRPHAFDHKDVASVQRFADFVEGLLELRWRRSQDEIPPPGDVRTVDGDVTDQAAFDLVLATNVSARASADHASMSVARRDELTGLANRQQFTEALATALLDVPQRQLTVMLIDLDRFKLINDRCGHDVGDLILKIAAARIASTARQTDVVARLGGDEFGVLCPLAPDAAQIVADRLCEQLRHPFTIGETQHFLSASVGITGRTDDSTAGSMLVEADLAMYASKQAGRDQSVLFDAGLKARIDEWSCVAHDLHVALDSDQFTLDFQPIVDSRSDRVYLEALLRWHHPTRGLIAPKDFLTVAEECGLIVAIGRDVMRGALGAAKKLDDVANFAGICVNVSVRQFNDDLVGQIRDMLALADLDPSLLIVEITESALAEADLAQRVVEGLRTLGVGVWIDDFGTGYSSLSRLSLLPVTGLKIDQSFIADLANPQSQCVTQTIIDLGRGLDLAVIGEGVEHATQAWLLEQMGCRYLQGFHFTRPMGFDDVASYVARGTRQTSKV